MLGGGDEETSAVRIRSQGPLCVVGGGRREGEGEEGEAGTERMKKGEKGAKGEAILGE